MTTAIAAVDLPPTFLLLATTLLGVVLVSLVLLKFRQSLLIAYFIAGVAIANSGVMGQMQADLTQDIPHLAEFGILLLLFTLGMEFSLGELKYLRRAAFLGGGLQVLGTLVLAVSAGWLLGFTGTHMIVFAVATALSSTAISVKVFQDRGLSTSPGARFALAVAIFQDLFIIGFLVFLPLLATSASSRDTSVAAKFGGVVLKGLFFVAMAFVLAKWIIPRLLHSVARTQSRELFTLTVTGLCLGVALLAGLLGLSLPLGAFVAGLAVSESIYKHRILADILPLKDLFLTLFFVSVGLMIHLPTAMQHLGLIVATAAILLLVKAALVFGIAYKLGLRPKASVAAALAMASAGEFSLVLIQKMRGMAPWPGDGEQILLASMALSMGLVPLLMQKAEWIGVKINPWFSQNANPLKSLLPPAKRVKEMRDHAIICGYGPVGRRLVKRLSSLAIPSVVVEINADTVKKLAASNQPVLFADVRDQETWHLAGIERARLVVFSFPDAATTADALYHVRVLNPAVHVIVRIKYASDQTRLKALGANTVVLDEEESGRALVRETQCVFDALPPAA